ncbi:hypothetical protein HC174_00335 [Salinimicrobium sp. CDJ15-81-2]|nr:hypothetical protein [Salinimicrobium nanhaiense]
MKKKIFFGFAFFVGLALMVAWQFAAAELADLQKNVDPNLKKHNVEVANQDAEGALFV